MGPVSKDPGFLTTKEAFSLFVFWAGIPAIHQAGYLADLWLLVTGYITGFFIAETGGRNN